MTGVQTCALPICTMEAKHIALSQSMRNLIPIREVLKEIMTVVFDRDHDVVYHSHSKAFDDVTSGFVERVDSLARWQSSSRADIASSI